MWPSKAPFTLLRVFYDPFLLHRCYSFTLLRFCTKRREKHPLLSVHIDPHDNKYGAKDIRFVYSHCSGSAKLIVEYWSVFKNLRICVFTLIQSVFKTSVFVDIHFQYRFRKPPFLWRFCADQFEHFHKNGGFSRRFCTKTVQCELSGTVLTCTFCCIHVSCKHGDYRLMIWP